MPKLEKVDTKETKVNETNFNNDRSSETKLKPQKYRVEVTAEVFEVLKKAQNYCVSKEVSIRPNLSKILEGLLSNPKESDYERIYKANLSPQDKLMMELYKYNLNQNKKLTLYEFMCEKLKIN